MLKTLLLFSVIALQQWLLLGAIPDCKSYQSVRSNCGNFSLGRGNRAFPKQYPFTALLFHKDKNDVSWDCVGTLISSRFVLTAAHCFLQEFPPTGVRLGELDYNATDDDAAPIDFVIKKYTLHPNYDFEVNLNDIVLVELDAEVKFNDYIMPACLPLPNDDHYFNQFTEAGWNLRHTANSSTHLLTVIIDRFVSPKCLAEIQHQFTFNATLQICGESAADALVECQISSGSPIFVDHPDYNCLAVVMGITSYSSGGCLSTNYYTWVPAYVDWISSII